MPWEALVMLVAVVLWSGVSAASRLAGALLGMVLSAGLGSWAWMVMAHGGRITFLGLGRPVPAPLVLGVVALMLFLNVVTLVRAWRARRPPEPAQPG